MAQTDSLTDSFTLEDDFSWDAPTKDSKTAVDNVVKAVKGEDDIEDDDEETVTKVDAKETSKPKEKAKEVEDNDGGDLSFEDLTPSKEKAKAIEKEGKDDKGDKSSVVDNDKDDVVDDGDDEETEIETFTALSQDLLQEGVFQNVEIPKDKKLTKAEFFEHFDTEIETRVTETLQGLFEDFDQDTKDFIKYKKDGGKTAEFLKAYSNPALKLPKEFDEDNAKVVKDTIDLYLTTVEELEGEELADRKDYLKEAGKEATFAKRWHKAMTEQAEAEKKAVLEAATIASEKAAKNATKFSENMGAVLDTDKLGDFTITKKEAKELHNYIVTPSVKVGKNKFVPAFSAELNEVLNARTAEDRKKLALLAKIFKNKFNFDDIKAVAETKVAKTAKSSIVRSKIGIKTNSTGNARKIALADLIDE